jgi:lipoprotein signal peptidase
VSTRPRRWKIVHFLRPVSAAAFVLGVDQLAKAGAAHATTSAHNPDLAFGIAHGPPPVLVAVSVLVLGVFLAVVGRLAVQAGISPVLPALIAGGMLGNVLDRARFGAVRDFIPTPFAIINIADIAVMAGVVALGVGLASRARHLRVR